MTYQREDIALGKPATQSSVSPWSRGDAEQDAARATSGVIHPDYAFHTDRQTNPWWQVDLEGNYIIEEICLLNRFNYAGRLRHFSLMASLDGLDWRLIYQKTDDRVLGNPDDLPLVLAGTTLARFIRVRLDDEEMLHFRSFQAFGQRALAIGSDDPEPSDVIFTEVPDAHPERSWIHEFCRRYSLDETIVRQQRLEQTLRIKAIPGREFRGDISVIRVGRHYGRFGNVFYQLLNAFIIARRIDCRKLEIPEFLWGDELPELPLMLEAVTVTGWSDVQDEPTLMGCLFAPTGFEPLFSDLGSHFTADTVQRYLRPFYENLRAGVQPLGSNVLAMHFRGGDIFTPREDGHIHAWYVQPPASYYIAALEYAQRHLGVDRVCLVFEDRSNPAMDCVEREMAARGIACQTQSADWLTDLRFLLGASHIVQSYGTFCEAIAMLSTSCVTYFGFRRLSSAHDVDGFPQSRVDEVLRAQGVRTILIDDTHDRYIPRRQWTASKEQLDLIRTFPQNLLQLTEIPSAPTAERGGALPTTGPLHEIPKAEPVRLVIWDLDETFWRGTLTEGGITLWPQAIEVIKELARRGIVSSICSKNDLEAVREILQNAGVWEYFVLPSITWEPKGSRIAALIEAIQLRPATVLFIDDNPINLQEALHSVPGIQIESPELIPMMLADSRFQGKDDPALERLEQYKKLERRKADEAAASGDVADFLRASDIRVRFDFEVIDHLDRAVELINRTNQLNFTKVRLPENPTEARDALRHLIASHEVRVALVGVRDKYGDHGWCGIYVLHNDGRLIHFAFSCRILGLHVETWLYNRLGCPRLEIQGDVLADVKAEGASIDWIQIENVSGTDDKESVPRIERVVARGGCDLMPVAHYFGSIAAEVVGEFNDNRFGMDGRVDHSTFLRTAFSDGLSAEAMIAAARLGYREGDFASAATDPHRSPEIWILSFWSDAAYVLYRHREHGFSVPFSLTGYHSSDAREADPDALRTSGVGAQILDALTVLKSDYDYIGFIGEVDFKETLRLICASANPEIQIFIVGANEYFVDSSGQGQIMNLTRQQNRWISEIIPAYPNVQLLNIRDHVRSEAEVHSPYHFDRMVYYRLFEFINSRLDKASNATDAENSAWAVHDSSDLNAALAATQSAEVLARTAVFLMAQGKLEDARRFAAKAMELEWLTLSGPVLHQIGLRLVESGEFEKAASVFESAARVEPTIFHHRHRWANALESLGRPHDAYAVLRDSLDHGDTNPHVLAHVARLLIRFGRLSEARAFLEECLKEDAEFPPFQVAIFSLEAAENALDTAGSGDIDRRHPNRSGVC
jgi:FkbH-like protein